ncbi:MAG: ATP-binding protein [Candidatus Cloacimonetes bacterium]|nr:ATP-binding protein [Candidatus Cloacimonadota bacterium]
MLVKFRVKNYRSFRDDTEFSMVASNAIKEHEETHVFQPKGRKYKLLKSAAIYGANASGKTNFLDAMYRMRTMVLHSFRDAEEPSIKRHPFLLRDNPESMPTEFEAIIIQDGIEYRYGFSFDAEVIKHEYLFRTVERESKLYERVDGSDFIFINNAFKEGKKLKDHLRPNVLFLSLLSYHNGEISKQVVAWFHQFNQLVEEFDAFPLSTIKILERNSTLKSAIIDMLQNADTDIVDFKVVDNGLDETPSISTQHNYFSEQVQGMQTISFDLQEHESQGTRRFLSLAGPIIDTLHRRSIVAIDEFESSLHPLLIEQLLRLLHSRDYNIGNAQFIYTTHSPYLLDQRIQRRDQVWLVEKDDSSSSQMIALSDYKVRNDTALAKNYLQGRFGGIPYIDSLLPEGENE